MEDKETLHFKIGVSGTSPNKQPEFNICINDHVYYTGMLSSPVNEVEYIDFDADISEGNHSLNITFLNKDPSDTVQKDGEIVEDLVLGIRSIEIDQIDIGTLKWTLSKYYPIYPEEYTDNTQKQITELSECVNLGWNGTWRLPFASPFYIWLLENL